jgi:Arc/MetJ family transcription regulator
MRKENAMRTTVTIDDELLASAKRYAGLEETSAMIREALQTYVQREAARRLALLGGSDPNAKAAPRKRPWIDPR